MLFLIKTSVHIGTSQGSPHTQNKWRRVSSNHYVSWIAKKISSSHFVKKIVPVRDSGAADVELFPTELDGRIFLTPATDEEDHFFILQMCSLQPSATSAVGNRECSTVSDLSSRRDRASPSRSCCHSACLVEFHALVESQQKAKQLQ